MAAPGAEFGGKWIPLGSAALGVGMTRFRKVRFFVAWGALARGFSACIAAAQLAVGEMAARPIRIEDADTCSVNFTRLWTFGPSGDPNV